MNSTPNKRRATQRLIDSAMHSAKVCELRQVAGPLSDTNQVRAILVSAIKRCSKSREVIADEMTLSLGRLVTEKMLNAFTGERDDRRWPTEFSRAFCAATGDYRLLSFQAEAAGFHVISEDDWQVLQLGRQVLAQKSARRQIALIEKNLNGRIA